ncbi:MAG TPA: condensation domain-containing protein, partial [Aggregatilineales bacterium]|nr:condensation domain-containing protein [Aggregatilineales bacterium]
RLDRLLADERTTGFDLADAPLMRVALLRTADDTHTLVWTHHHILLDGWSQPQLLHEVMVLYEGYRQGREVRLDPPKPYRDYVAWLNKQDMAAAEAYWRRVLAGFTAPTPLAIEGLGVAEDDPAYGEMEIHLPRETTALQALAAKQHVTMSTIAQGAWALLLSRYSGEDDVVFGVTVSGRPADLPGAESMIGLFINTLPVRVRVNPEAVVADWLKELQVQAVEMRQYEYSPLVEVQRWSDVEPGQPLFKSILVFENFPVAGAMSRHEGDLRIEDVRFIEQTEFPLTFVSGVGDEMLLKIAYDGQVVSRDTVTRILGHLATLLEGIAAAPDGTLADLPMLTEAERRQVVVEWNRTDAPFPADKCAHELFEAQAASTPEAIALAFEDQTMTYAELNARANRLARTLQARGVGPETIVGVAIDRSFDMIVAVLGILKAGGAYLPLDPSYPPERLGYIVEDSGIKLLVTHASLVDGLPEHRAEMLCLDVDWPQIEQASAENPESGAMPGSLAYVIYTSGSTGQPKGSLLEHRGLSNLATGYVNALGIRPGSRVLQFFSFGFDGSLLEIFPTLTSGATLVLARRETLLSPAGTHELMRAEKITHSLMPPAMLAVLPTGELPDLKVLVSGGDALAAGWHHRVSGPHRLPGEGARLPHRARRDRKRADRAPDRQAGGSEGAARGHRRG